MSVSKTRSDAEVTPGQDVRQLPSKKWLKPGPESGLDCLICAEFDRHRTAQRCPGFRVQGFDSVCSCVCPACPSGGTAQAADTAIREGLVFKAHRLVYHSTLGWRVMKKKNAMCADGVVRAPRGPSINRDTSLIRNTPLLGPYSRTIPRVPWWS